MDVVMFDPWDEATLRDWHRAWVAAQREIAPEDPPDPFEFVAAHARHRPSDAPNRLAVARDARGPAAAMWLEWYDGPDNRHRLDHFLMLRPDVDAVAHATALLRPAADLAGEIGRTTMGFDAVAGGAAARLARAAGGRMCLTERRSVLRLADVPRADVETWLAVPEGYTLVTWDDRCPDDLLPAYVRAADAMNTAPRGELSLEDVVMTPERMREREQVSLARGSTTWVAAARHDETGEIAGYTELAVNRWRPWLAEQENTAVVPGHRGRRLGRLVKAVNVLRLLDERPEVDGVETWNAASNSHMLAINVAMGFRPRELWEEFELPVAALADAPAAL